MAIKTQFEMNNPGMKNESAASSVDSQRVAEERRAQMLREYAKDDSVAGGMPEDMADLAPGPFNTQDEESIVRPPSDLQDLAAMPGGDLVVEAREEEELGLESGSLIPSTLDVGGVAGETVPEQAASRFSVVGHGESMSFEGGQTPVSSSFAVIRDSQTGEDTPVTGGEDIAGLGKVLKVSLSGEGGLGVEVLSEVGRGPGTFYLPLQERTVPADETELLSSMMDAGPNVGIMSPSSSYMNASLPEMGQVAADILGLNGLAGASGQDVGLPTMTPGQQAVIGTPTARDYLAGEQLLSETGGNQQDLEIESALMGDMGYEALKPQYIPEIGQGLRTFSQQPGMAVRPIQYGGTGLVDNQMAHWFNVGAGEPGDVWIYYPSSSEGRMGNSSEVVGV